jgi:hypothetical protein
VPVIPSPGRPGAAGRHHDQLSESAGCHCHGHVTALPVTVTVTVTVIVRPGLRLAAGPPGSSTLAAVSGFGGNWPGPGAGPPHPSHQRPESWLHTAPVPVSQAAASNLRLSLSVQHQADPFYHGSEAS